MDSASDSQGSKRPRSLSGTSPDAVQANAQVGGSPIRSPPKNRVKRENTSTPPPKTYCNLSSPASAVTSIQSNSQRPMSQSSLSSIPESDPVDQAPATLEQQDDTGREDDSNINPLTRKMTPPLDENFSRWSYQKPMAELASPTGSKCLVTNLANSTVIEGGHLVAHRMHANGLNTHLFEDAWGPGNPIASRYNMIMLNVTFHRFFDGPNWGWMLIPEPKVVQELYDLCEKRRTERKNKVQGSTSEHSEGLKGPAINEYFRTRITRYYLVSLRERMLDWPIERYETHEAVTEEATFQATDNSPSVAHLQGDGFDTEEVIVDPHDLLRATTPDATDGASKNGDTRSSPQSHSDIT
ncbi:hypothetical protein CONPUDRAFT_161782, partial [Coniophora puteana RWD-64-598 SS2]